MCDAVRSWFRSSSGTAAVTFTHDQKTHRNQGLTERPNSAAPASPSLSVCSVSVWGRLPGFHADLEGCWRWSMLSSGCNRGNNSQWDGWLLSLTLTHCSERTVGARRRGAAACCAALLTERPLTSPRSHNKGESRRAADITLENNYGCSWSKTSAGERAHALLCDRTLF